MIKKALPMVLICMLAACSTTKQTTQTAEQQVAGIKQMCSDNAENIKKRQQAKSLYSRLGGREGIATFSDKLYEAHLANDKINHLFKHVPKHPLVDNLTNFLVYHSGGGGNYSGRSMTDVHKNMNISYEDFLSAGGDVQTVMKELGAGENEIQEAVCFLVSYIPQVVTQ